MTHFLDCSVESADNELFIVEGKSALDALNQVRSRASQAVFALQGKLPNAEKHSVRRVLQNKHARSLLATLGHSPETVTVPGGQGHRQPDCRTPNPAKPAPACRFRQVLLATDPDTDGAHSRWLLLTLLQHFCPPLLESGRVRVIAAPMFRAVCAAAENPRYFWSEHEKQHYLAARPAGKAQDVTAFKGLASLSADELHYWVVAEQTRRYATSG